MFLCRGLVPLHNACSYGHFEVTELLLKVRIFAYLTLKLLMSIYEITGSDAVAMLKTYMFR